MSDTLLTVIQRVLTATGQDPSVSTLSDTDDTQYIADRINDALLRLRSLRPTVLDNNATITVVPNTRLYAVATGLDVYEVNKDSLRLDSGTADWIQLSRLVEQDPTYDTYTADKVRYLYFENNKIGVYPILETGADNQTIKYQHPDVWARLDDPADTFPYDDPYWVTYCEKYAQVNYEIFKGLGNPMATNVLMDDAWGVCLARAAITSNRQMRGLRRYSR